MEKRTKKKLLALAIVILLSLGALTAYTFFAIIKNTYAGRPVDSELIL